MKTHLNAPDLNLYLGRLDHKAIHYRAQLVIDPQDDNAKYNLKLLDRMAVQAIDMHLSGKDL
jgi:hypothetical protein